MVKIPIKAFMDDTNLPLEERFNNLLAHHEEETKWLITELSTVKEAMHKEIEGLEASRERLIERITLMSEAIHEATYHLPCNLHSNKSNQCVTCQALNSCQYTAGYFLPEVPELERHRLATLTGKLGHCPAEHTKDIELELKGVRGTQAKAIEELNTVRSEKAKSEQKLKEQREALAEALNAMIRYCSWEDLPPELSKLLTKAQKEYPGF